jgi:DNA polymerase I-like protein with 3'-5' exonuclease and polymerase domains
MGKLLAIIDGKSVFYRGFYAMGGLSTKDGVPTGGVYGFVAMSLELLRKFKPDYVAVAWDKPKTNINSRLKTYPQYKAHRKPAPPEFYAQIPILHNLLEALNWPLYECDNYEADDIIGALAQQADQRGDIDTIMITSDLDMLQIVDSNTKLYALKKGFTDIEEFDIAALEKKYGIKKDQFLDLKALKGDASDNIPGAPGIGEKTAIALLQEFGDIDGIYANIEQVKPAWAKKLIDGKELVYISKQLGQIQFDAPVKLDLDQMDVRKLDAQKLRRELEKLEFRSLIRRLPDYMQSQVDTNALITENNNSEQIKKLDLTLEPILQKMSARGVRLDKAVLSEIQQKLALEISDLEGKIFETAGQEFNISSPMQVGEVLFSKLKLPSTGLKKTARGVSTGAKELAKLAKLHPIVPLIESYRELTKLQSTYVEALPKYADENGYIHTTFSQTVTATGRLSSSDPNLQNIPVRTEIGREIRRALVASPGKIIVGADYSQFELRLAAALAKDQDLIADFDNDELDIHKKTAAEAFGVPIDKVTDKQRRAAKVINFGVLYGMSPRGLSEAADMSFAEAKDFIERYFELRKPLSDFIDQTIAGAEKNGFVQTLFGRRRQTPDIYSPNFIVRQAARRQAANMPIQGTEADIMKMAMIKVEREIPEASQFMQIHDSIMVECDPADAAKVGGKMKQIMENIYPKLGVKLKVDIKSGKNWSEI